MCFSFLVFLFYNFWLSSPCGRLSRLMSAFERTLKYHLVSYRKIWLLIVEIALLADVVQQAIIYVKCCADLFICLGVFLLPLFNFSLLNLFIYLC